MSSSARETTVNLSYHMVFRVTKKVTRPTVRTFMGIMCCSTYHCVLKLCCFFDKQVKVLLKEGTTKTMSMVQKNYTEMLKLYC